MSSQNNDDNGMAFVALILGGLSGLLVVLIASIMVAAAFLALIVTAGLSLVCLYALWRPVTIGSRAITAEHAGVFLQGGLWGITITLCLLMFLKKVVGLDIYWGGWQWYAAGGYVAGAWLADIVFAPKEEVAEPEEPQLPPPPEKLPPPPFKFARWNDEDLLQ